MHETFFICAGRPPHLCRKIDSFVQEDLITIQKDTSLICRIS